MRPFLAELSQIAGAFVSCYPNAGLLPETPDDEVRILEVMDYVVGTLHMQGFARIFTTEKFTPNKADHDAVRNQGRTIIDDAFTVIDALLADREYVVESFSIADAALFYTEFWAQHSDLRLPVHCAAHYKRMLERPAVRRVLTEEGYRV